MSKMDILPVWCIRALCLSCRRIRYISQSYLLCLERAKAHFGQKSGKTLRGHFFHIAVVFYFSLLYLLSPVVVDDVSECLWQLCVMSNRAERLLRIKLFENLFM